MNHFGPEIVGSNLTGPATFHVTVPPFFHRLLCIARGIGPHVAIVICAMPRLSTTCNADLSGSSIIESKGTLGQYLSMECVQSVEIVLALEPQDVEENPIEEMNQLVTCSDAA